MVEFKGRTRINLGQTEEEVLGGVAEKVNVFTGDLEEIKKFCDYIDIEYEEVMNDVIKIEDNLILTEDFFNWFKNGF